MPLHRRLPKRGFHHEKRHPLAEINLDVLEGAFQDGDEITTDRLREAGIIKSAQGGVKLLGRGEITKRLILKVQAVSASARAKVEQAGGSVIIAQLAVGDEAAPVAAPASPAQAAAPAPVEVSETTATAAEDVADAVDEASE